MTDGTITCRGPSFAVFPLMLALFVAPQPVFGAMTEVALEPATPERETSDGVALVIGNSLYEHVPELRNPVNDAADVGAAFERLGFDVTRLENAGHDLLRKGLDDFGAAASRADIAVVFYAGHAFDAAGLNYLVPVDASVQVAPDPGEAVPVEVAILAVENAARHGVLIVDAMPGVPVEPECGTLVAWAARPGTVAHDGADRNSPYTEALLRHLEEPGLELGTMFRMVRDEVARSTESRQQPVAYGSLPAEGVYLTEAAGAGDYLTVTPGVSGAQR